MAQTYEGGDEYYIANKDRLSRIAAASDRMGRLVVPQAVMIRSLEGDILDFICPDWLTLSEQEQLETRQIMEIMSGTFSNNDNDKRISILEGYKSNLIETKIPIYLESFRNRWVTETALFTLIEGQQTHGLWINRVRKGTVTPHTQLVFMGSEGGIIRRVELLRSLIGNSVIYNIQQSILIEQEDESMDNILGELALTPGSELCFQLLIHDIQAMTGGVEPSDNIEDFVLLFPGEELEARRLYRKCIDKAKSMIPAAAKDKQLELDKPDSNYLNWLGDLLFAQS